MKVDVGRGIELEVRVEGEGEPLVMLMGLGRQLIHWPQALVDQLVAAGFQVIRPDNRDAGLSTFIAGPPPNLKRAVARKLTGRSVEAPYGLHDMADDVAGLLDALGIERTHLVGTSLGGMISQVFALKHPQRLRTLTSLMSTPAVRPRYFRLRAASALIGSRPTTEEQAVARSVRVFRQLGSPTWPRIDERVAAEARQAWERNPDASGLQRHLLVALAAPSRERALREVRCPTLVLHGERDPLIRPRAGKATAEAIPGARWRPIPDMGHELHPQALPTIAGEVAALAGLRAAEGAAIG